MKEREKYIKSENRNKKGKAFLICGIFVLIAVLMAGGTFLFLKNLSDGDIIGNGSINDQKLMLLEQISYLDENIPVSAGVEEKEPEEGMTVKELLSCYDESALNRLEKIGYIPTVGDTVEDKDGDGEADMGASCQGNEWAAIIRAIQGDEALSSLKIKDFIVENGKIKWLCLYDTEIPFLTSMFPERAIVLFRGTVNVEEWKDNVKGIIETDTPRQQEALDYINSLDIGEITVVGHSKGGNKAQYVALLSDKVVRCVSMDGQGFSKAFIEKYADRIRERADMITCYSVDEDFVHALLFPLPQTTQLFCKGYGMVFKQEAHWANSFFRCCQDENNYHSYIETDEDGAPVITFTEENEDITVLHKFSSFIMNTMSDEEKSRLVDFMSNILEASFSTGEKQQSAGEAATSDYDALALVTAYVFKYADVYDLSDNDFYDMLEVIGSYCMEDLAEFARTAKNPGDSFAVMSLLPDNLSLLSWTIENLRDGEAGFGDTVEKLILSAVQSWFSDETSLQIDTDQLWDKCETIFSQIGDIDAETAVKDAELS